MKPPLHFECRACKHMNAYTPPERQAESPPAEGEGQEAAAQPQYHLAKCVNCGEENKITPPQGTA